MIALFCLQVMIPVHTSSSSLPYNYDLPQNELDYDSESSLNHNVVMMEWSCVNCSYKSGSYSDYLKHINTTCYQKNQNHNEIGSSSKITKELVAKKSEISEKLIVADNMGLFNCTICSHVTNRKQNMMKHMMTHTGERPFACTFCPYRGVQKHHLDNHMMTHTGDRPYACSLCSYRGIQKHHYLNHIKTHSDKK